MQSCCLRLEMRFLLWQPRRAASSCAHETCTRTLLVQAELAERDFAADRGEVIVISTGAVDGKVDTMNPQERRAAEDKNRHK